MATAIFLVETLVMFILNEMPPISRGLEAILDSTILLLLLTPFYLYIYRPFWDERQRKERQIRYLSQQLLIATEAESKRIAHEIHDQCGQTLTALQFGLQTLKKQIPAKDASSLAQTDKLVQVVAQLSDELRDLTTRLRPVVLDQVGLIAALTWQIETFQKNFPGINITARLIRKSDLAGKFSSNVEDAIFRICQEALTNIARHASATVVLLYLTLEGRRMELKIEDNGVGFELDRCLEQEDGKCGFGLLGMRERALMGEGRFNISTAPGQGTSILASFPLTEEQTQ
jgi:signal transduction histidine kinase